MVSVFTPAVGHAPARPSGGTGLEPGSSAPSSRASASVAGSGWLRPTISAPAGGWLVECQTHGAFQPARGQPLRNRRRQGGKMRAGGIGLRRLQRRIEPAHRPLDEAAHLVRAAEQRAPALPFGRHLLGSDRVLREAGARAPLALLGIAPARLHCGGRRGEAEIKAELPRPALAQQDRVHQRAGDRAALLGQRDRHAGRLPDRLGLAQNDIEHRAVDGAVGREEQHRADQFRGLAEAIDPALALLMARRVPGQIVVDDGVEQIAAD